MQFALVLLWSLLFLRDFTAVAAVASVEERQFKIVRYFCGRVTDGFEQESYKDDDSWHQNRSVEIRDIVKQLPDGKQTNFAMFRLRMFLPGGKAVTLFDCTDTVFASGGDKACLGKLNVQQKQIKCAADYWHPYPDRIEDGDLRKSIADILDLNEAVDWDTKNAMLDAFKQRIKSPGYIESPSNNFVTVQISLGEAAVEKFTNS